MTGMKLKRERGCGQGFDEERCGCRVGSAQLEEGAKQEKERGKYRVQSSRNLGEDRGSAFFFQDWRSRKPLGWHNLQESGQERPNYWSDTRNAQATVGL